MQNDLVTRLIADSTQYTQGTRQARTENDALKGSVNSIIGQLSRQKAMYEAAGRSTLDWIEADKKATNESRELAKTLMSEVDALKQVAAERQRLSKIQPGTGPMGALTKPDYFGRGLDRLKTQSEIDAEKVRAAAARDAKDPFLQGMSRYQAAEDPFQRGLRQRDQDARDKLDRERKAAEDAKIEAARAARDPFSSRLAKYQTSEDPFQRGLRQIGVDNANAESDKTARLAAGKAGDKWRDEDAAGKAHLENVRKLNADLLRERLDREAREHDIARTAVGRLIRDDADEINVQRQLDERRANQRTGRSQTTGGKNRPQILMELTRGFEDASAGAAYGGFRGAVMGASNNISQIGALMGPTGGIVAGLISTTAILGTTIASAYDSWENKSQAIKFELDQQKVGVSKIIAELDNMTKVREIRLSLKREFNVDSLTQRQEQVNVQRTGNAEKQSAQQAELDRFRQLAELPEGMDSQAIIAARREKLRRQRVNNIPDWMPGSGAPALTNSIGNIASAEAVSEDTLNGLIEREKARDEAVRQGTLASKEATLVERQLAKARELEMRIGQDQADRQSAIERSRRVGGRGPISEWEQLQLERGNRNAENAKQKAKFEGSQSWFQKDSEKMLLAGMKTDTDRAAYQAQKEYQERLKRSEESQRIGTITQADRERFDAAALKDRDRTIREAKYGNLQADGRTGFQSADSRSTQGVNAIMQAIQYSRQTDERAQLMKIGDATQETANAIKNGITINNLAPVQVMDFN